MTHCTINNKGTQSSPSITTHKEVMFTYILNQIENFFNRLDRKSFDEHFKYAQDIVDVERIINELQRTKPGGIL